MNGAILALADAVFVLVEALIVALVNMIDLVRSVKLLFVVLAREVKVALLVVRALIG